VGPKRKKFVIHKHLLCNSCEFFEKGFVEDAFREGRDGEMYLSHDSPNAISLFIDWLYRERLPEGQSQQYLDDLYDLYFFAVKLDMSFLMDQTMGRIQDTCARYDKYISPESIRKIYGNTMKSKRSGCCLRDFVIYVFMFELLKSQQETLDKVDKAVEKHGAEHGGGGIFDAPFFNLRSIMTPLKLPLEVIRTIWELGKDDFDLSQDTFTRFQAENMGAVDPRTRKDHDLHDRCFFHSHQDTKAEKGVCYLDYRVSNLTWVENGAEQNEVTKPSQEESRENQDETYTNHQLKLFQNRSLL
jgi:hypothetical protein